MLHRFVEFIQTLAAGLGGPGLLLIAFLDSSFLTFPEVPDLLLIWSVIHRPALWPYYAGMATLGSVLGCYALYAVSKAGGEAVIRKRFHAKTVERTLRVIRRYGVLAVIVPSILPPPAPFKIFVILAGVAGIPSGSFLTAIVIGRGFRYVIEALLAYAYGDRAILYMKQHMAQLSIWTAAAVAVVGVALVLWRRRRRTG
jgi:membrane protein YqaA with SNARE-associated domain